MSDYFELTNENIDKISEQAVGYLKKCKQRKEDILRARLTLETALLYWQEQLPAGYQARIKCFNHFGRPVLRLTMVGDCINPLKQSEGVDEFFEKMQGNLGAAVTFRYVKNLNIVDIKLPMNTLNSWQKNILALVVSVLTWAVFNFFIPDWGPMFLSGFVTPTFKMLLGLMKALASFMVFFNVLNAVCNMGDVGTLSKLGLHLIKREEMANAATVFLAFAVGVCAFDVIDFSAAGSGGVFGEIYKIILGIAPASLIQPFVNGNTLQILFMSVAGGVLLLMLNGQMPNSVKVVGELNAFFMMAISRFCALIPLIVYLSFTSLLLSGKLFMLAQIWKIPAVMYLVEIIWIVGFTVFTAWQMGFDLKKHVKRLMPVTMLAYITSSTIPCIPLMTKILTEEGVDPDYRDFALPLSQILCSSGIAISMAIVALGLEEMAGLHLSLTAFCLTVLSVFMLSQTVPPVPGSSISIMTLILMQNNIPQECIALWVSIDFFLNMMRTCCGKTTVMNCVLACAKSAGKMKA